MLPFLLYVTVGRDVVLLKMYSLDNFYRKQKNILYKKIRIYHVIFVYLYLVKVLIYSVIKEVFILFFHGFTWMHFRKKAEA